MLSCPLQFDYINEIYNTLFRWPPRSAWIVVLMLFSGTRYPNNHRWMSLRRCRAHLLLKASCAVISASLSKCFMITVTTVNCCYSTHVLLTACNLHKKKTPSLLSVKEDTYIKFGLRYQHDNLFCNTHFTARWFAHAARQPVFILLCGFTNQGILFFL